jgi:tetratricopeptide (TPR) repeat protein
MERSKYQLILMLLILFITPAGGENPMELHKITSVDACEPDHLSLFANTSSMAGTVLERNIIRQSHKPFKEQIYQAYIAGDMKIWLSVINTMEAQKIEEPGFLLELINYQYGYVAWCLGNNNKTEAKHYLSLLEKNLAKLKSIMGKTAEYHAYSAAAYGFKIGLTIWRAPLLGPKSMKHAQEAIQADSLNFQANMEMGNIWNHMPAVFGGSGEKALDFYLQALEIMEQKPETVRNNNWMYLNLLALIGQVQQGNGQPEQAKKYFDRALQFEPEFIWVKKELLPSLIE